MSANGAARRLRVLIVVSGLAAMSLVSCAEEQAVPIDPANPPTGEVQPPDVTHQIAPTPQMEQLAREQCLDDPTLTEGYVEAVDPESEQVLAEVSIDCATVRGDGE